MLYAVIKHFDSMCEIATFLLTDTRKLTYIGITFKIGRSTLVVANRRRPEAIFQTVYRDLYARYRHDLILDSLCHKHLIWIDSTEIAWSS